MKRMALLLVLLAAAQLNAQKLRSGDPVKVDNDTVVDVRDITPLPANDLRDFLVNSFRKPGDRKTVHAVNVNSLGETPDSSWFQNRHGSRRMSLEELARGPNTSDGPSVAGPWRVLDIKSEGVTPGLWIQDFRGDVYILKFDPVKYPEMASAAEVISTKFFYAMGYNVPENFIATFPRGQLWVAPNSGVTEKKIDSVLKRVRRDASGMYRAMASKYLKGKPLGPFEYYGTRSDDPNDIFAHENRRELRGLRMMSAWLNHDDSRSINTLDMLVSEKGRHYVRHYLLDFGSTLGSATYVPQEARPGFEYLWEPRPALVRAATLGIVDRGWVRADYVKAPSLGKLEFKRFDPAKWKPQYPNAAFSNATSGDIYWAAKIIMAFTDEDIRAIVHTGQLSDPAAEATLVKWLIERRDRIGRYAFLRVPSIDHFSWTSEGGLKFDHLASLYGFAAAPESFDMEWSDCGELCRVARISAKGSTGAVHVTLRQAADYADYAEIVAVERDGEGER